MDPLDERPAAKCPGELYMAFGPANRVVKAGSGSAETLRLAHLQKGEDGLWRRHCPPQDFPQEDPEGTELYRVLRRLVDACQDLVELEP